MNTQIQQAPEPVHLVALSGCHTAGHKIRYACEHNRPNPTPAVVRDWLARHGVQLSTDYVSIVVGAWRAEHDLPSTTTSPEAERERQRGAGVAAGRVATPEGARGFYLVAALSLAVSFDTAWRFFGEVLGITGWERPIMFAVVEAALIACGYGMRATVRRTGRAGPARLWVWVLCGLAGYMALVLSGPIAGAARVALGPALGLVMLHLALGIEIRVGQHARTTAWARVGRELRERMLSRLGLADDERDALARTGERAARRVARLSKARFALFRTARVVRNLARSNAAHDPSARARMLAELAALQHAGILATLDQPSPWLITTASSVPSSERSVNGEPSRSLNSEPRSVNGQPDRSVNGKSAGVRDHRPRTSGTRRAPGPAPRGRRKLDNYIAEAREHLTSDVAVVTPAWVRKVIPGCPQSTSKNVADELNRQLQAGHGGEVTT